MDVLSICPMLIPQNTQRTVYEGFIVVKNQDFHVHISLGCRGELNKARVCCEWKLAYILKGYNRILQQRLQHSTSLAAFLVEFKSILERQLDKKWTGTSIPAPPHFYTQLIEDIEHLGWHRLVYIDSNFEQLHLQAVDVHSRSHILKVQLSSQHPEVSPRCLAELPQTFEHVWSSKSGNLQSLHEQFEKQLNVYQEFWNMMDEIDKNTWVLEPERPTRSAVHRRIALGNNASLQMEVDPSHPAMLPEIRFLGADHVINPLKENLNNNIEKWNQELSLLINLESVLQVQFPSPATTKKEDFSVECGICYAYRLDNQIPDQVCDDSRCGQPFHQGCLYEWLRTLASSRQSFNTVFGECPYCSKPITVKMPTR